jgi:hypothetical protein
LREACQTEVDGTSIETLEELASGLGAPVEQVLLPKDLVLLEEARALPAIAVLRLPNGSAHFAVVWSVVAGVAQVMDPAHGRRWLSRAKLLDELYEHVMTVPASDWREWAGSGGGSRFRRRLRDPAFRGNVLASYEHRARRRELSVLRGSRRRHPMRARESDLLLCRESCSDQAPSQELWSVRPSLEDAARHPGPCS